MVDTRVKENFKSLIKYCYEILKHQSSKDLFFNIREESEYFIDLSDIIKKEILLFGEEDELFISKADLRLVNSLSQEKEIFDKVRRIYDNYTNNPYELEIVYCYLFILGKKNDGKKIFAPLFNTIADLKYDENKRGFSISLVSDEIRLNVFALVELYPEKESALMSKIADVTYLEFPLDLKNVNGILHKIADLHPAIKCNPLESKDFSSLVNDLKNGEFTIYNSSGIALTKKSNIYIINDLQKLLEIKEPDINSSVIKRFIVKNIDDDSILGKTSWKTLLIPFPANPEQIKVIKELGDNQFIHVQGPPGTGKSQTIANLVCHMVASGYTVLVTSQKNKALEVVSEKLEQLQIKYLYMKLLKDDKESKKKIKEFISELISDVLQQDLKDLEDEKTQLEKKLDIVNEKLSKLFKEFEQSRNLEFEKIDELNLTIGEIYSCYEKLKPFDMFEENELVFSFSEKLFVKENLITYLNELEKIGDEYFKIEKLLNTEKDLPKDPLEIKQFLEDLEKIKFNFEQEISLISSDEANYLIETLPCFQFLKESRLKKLDSEMKKLKEQVEQYLNYLTIINECNKYFLGKIVNFIWRQFRLFIPRNKLRFQLNRYFGKWLNINDFNSANENNEILVKIDKVISILNVLDIRKQVEFLINKLNLSVKNISIICPYCKQKLSLDLNKSKSRTKCSKCENEFYFCPTDIKDDVISFNLLKYNLYFSYKNKDFTHFNDVFKKTKNLITKATFLLNVLRIEKSFINCRNTILKIKSSLLSDKTKFDFFRDNIEKIIECGILKKIIKEKDKKFRSTQTIAEEIKNLNKEKNRIIKKLIEVSIRYNLRKKLDKKSLQNDLLYFAKILQQNKKRYITFEKLKNYQIVDFKEVLSALPCWIISINDVARVFPLNAGLFDVVVIDESSQCAIPSAIPVLYRGKKVVIVGDDKQLPNVEMQFVDDQFNQSLIKDNKIDNLPRSQSFDCKTNSLFDLCGNFADTHIFLREHFRCYPEIIRFCNEKFYNGRLILTKSSLNNHLGRILNIELVEDGYDDETLGVNKKEAEAVVKKIKMLITMPKYKNLTFGIMSIFREQVEYIKDLIYTSGTGFYIDPETRRKFKLIIETADGFQGDERDVILYSFRFASNSSPNILAHTRREEDFKRLNVAFSRARYQIFCFVSTNISDFPRGFLRDFLEYVQNPKSLDVEYQPWDSEFEKEVQTEIEKLGFKVYPQFKTCGFKIDLVVLDEKGKVLAIECDGWKYHYDEYGNLYQRDLERQQILERAGWKVVRITSRDFYRDRKKVLDSIIRFFK